MPNIENLKKGVKTQFKKGKSGNPKGYLKGKKNRATILKKWIECKTKFKNPITEKEGISGTCEDQVILGLIKKAISGDVQAIKEINDTLYGKIPEKQTIEQSGKIKINFKSD